MYKDCGWSGGKAGDKQKGNNEQWLCNVVIFLMVTSWFLCFCWLFNSMFSFKVFSDSTWDMLRLKTGNFWRYTFVLSYVWFCFKISMIQITCSFFCYLSHYSNFCEECNSPSTGWTSSASLLLLSSSLLSLSGTLIGRSWPPSPGPRGEHLHLGDLGPHLLLLDGLPPLHQPLVLRLESPHLVYVAS